MEKIKTNPILLFMPFLLIYITIVLLGHKDIMEGDEGRYYMYAQNLMHGFYSPPGEVFLWNGPGYPLFIVPFISLGLPLICLTLSNAFFQYISVIFIYKTLGFFTNRNWALFFSIFWGLYYVAFKEMTLLYTEPLASMLVCLFAYYVTIAFHTKYINWKLLIISGLLLAYLTLVKVILGYVLLLMFFLMVSYFLIRRTIAVKKGFIIILIALLGNFPYLFYTWHLTGKPLYWANIGGMCLYWASTPVEGEYGEWNDDYFTAYCGYDKNIPCNSALFAVHHNADYQYVYQYNGVKRDEAFRSIALKNIKKYPFKYVKNCLANISRLFLGIPFSYYYYRYQDLLRIPPGGLVLIMLIFNLIISLLNLKKLPFIIIFLAGILVVYLGASILVSGYQRLLTMMVPLIIIWTAYLFDKTVIFSWKLK